MIPAGLQHLLDQIKADPTIRLPLINLYGPPASGKTFIYKEIVAYMASLLCITDAYSRTPWTSQYEGAVLIHIEGIQGIPPNLNDMFLTLHTQHAEPRTVRNISHWITEYNVRITGALNYEIKRSN